MRSQGSGGLGGKLQGLAGVLGASSGALWSVIPEPSPWVQALGWLALLPAPPPRSGPDGGFSV